MQSKTKSLTASIQKSGADATFVLSTSDVDRDQDTISTEALKGAIKGMSRLITLWQHKSDQPIGFWENLKVEGKRLIGDLQVSSTNLGNLVKQLLVDDVPLAASIGFIGKGEWNDKRGGIDFTEIEILECSVVSVPANARAVRISKSALARAANIDIMSIIDVDAQSQSIGDTHPAVLAAIMKSRTALAAAHMTVRK